MAHVETLLEVDQGADFTQSWQWGYSPSENSEVFTPYNLTGYTAKCQIRARPDLTGPVFADNVPVTLGTTDGMITLTISSALSKTWKWNFGFYDIALTKPDGTIVRFAQGQIMLDRAVTNA